ncbi:MAG: hypothetical protein IT515_05860 [Burkholderiales bacterium]|nr:hypothetical protein [Burkholderiales bacterium]
MSMAEKTAPRTAGARRDEILDPQALISVGVGYAALTRDGEPVYEAKPFEFEHAMSVADAEALARKNPQRDWRIQYIGLLDERQYRRAGAGRWVLVRRGYGLS